MKSIALDLAMHKLGRHCPAWTATIAGLGASARQLKRSNHQVVYIESLAGGINF
jgi:hypothetical protein